MTRESRHLKISQLSEPIDEQQLLNYFKSYGRVQKLEILKDEPGAVVVSFMDMRTASKALGVDHAVAGHSVKASYYEPDSTGLSSTVIQIHDSDESLLHSRHGGGGSTTQASQQQQESRRTSSGQRGGFGSRSYGRGSNWSSSGSGGHQTASSSARQEGVNYDRSGNSGGGFREPHGRSNGLDGSSQQPRRSISRLSGCGSSRKRSDSSGSPKADVADSSPENSRRSSATRSRSRSLSGSPPSRTQGRYSVDLRHQQSGFREDSGRASSCSGGSQREQTTIVVRNLPRRSTDSSIKDGLFFTYKKHAKVVSVKVIGSAADRYALVTFRSSFDASKAVTATNGEMFFGSRIIVEMAPVGLDGDDNERRPLEKDIDQYHPRSSRTLYVGNLENRITTEQLRQIFGVYGDILDIDIKNRETPAPFSFIQYSDIVSVVKAIHSMEQDGYIGNNKIKVGFGKPLPSTMVWLEDLPSHVTDEYLNRKMNFYGTITDVVIDKSLRQALVTYESIEAAQSAVTDMKGRTINGRKVQIDFCSRELHDLFVDRIFRYGKNSRGSTTETGSLCGGSTALPLPSTSSVPLGRSIGGGRKATYDYYGNDSHYESNGPRFGYGQRSGTNRGIGMSFDDYGSMRDYNDDDHACARMNNYEFRKGRGRSTSPSRFSSGKYQYWYDDVKYSDDTSRGGNLHQLRGRRGSRSPPTRHGTHQPSRDPSYDRIKQRKLTKDDSSGRFSKRPHTPPDDQFSSHRKDSGTDFQRHRYQPTNRRDRRSKHEQHVTGDNDSSTSGSESESSTSRSSSSSSGNGEDLAKYKRKSNEAGGKVDQQAAQVSVVSTASSQSTRPEIASNVDSSISSIPAATSGILASDTEINKLNRERERLLQVLEHLTPDEDGSKSTNTAVVSTPSTSGLKPKLSEVFDLDWVKTTAEQEQKIRRQSALDIKAEPSSPIECASVKRRSSGSVGVVDTEQDSVDFRHVERRDTESHQRNRASKHTIGAECVNETSQIIKSLDDPDPEPESDAKIKEGQVDESNIDLTDAAIVSSASLPTSQKDKELSEIAATKRLSNSSTRSSLGSKAKLIPLKSDGELTDPRSNPPNVHHVKDLPLPNFANKRHISRQPHQGGIGKANAGFENSQSRKVSTGDSKNQEQASAKPNRVIAMERGLRAPQTTDSGPNSLDQTHDIGEQVAQRRASLRQRNSSASEQLSPLISSGGEFSATDSDGALMSPAGCGNVGDGSSNVRIWTNTTVDIFGEAVSPNSGASQSSSLGQASASSKRSLEERIRALDAKFSALDQMIKGAKERPQQPIRQSQATSIPVSSSSVTTSSVDYSKYKVVKKPSTCGSSLSPSSAGQANVPLDVSPIKATNAVPASHQRMSAFDYDCQRLLGNVAVGTVATSQDDSNNLSQSSSVKNVAATMMKPPLTAVTTTVHKPSVVTTTAPPLIPVSQPPSTPVSAPEASRSGGRPLTISIPPAPLSSSSSCAPTPGGCTPLSPTGMPLQGILKNKPRTPTGEGIQGFPLPHQDPRTAARKESLKSPVETTSHPVVPNTLTKASSISKLTEALAPPLPKVSSGGIGSSTSAVRPVFPVSHQLTQQKPVSVQPSVSRGHPGTTETKPERQAVQRPVDRSQSTSSLHGNTIGKQSIIGGDSRPFSTAPSSEQHRKLSMPATNHGPESHASPVKELRGESQLPKFVKKSKPSDKGADSSSSTPMEKTKRPELEKKATDNKKEKLDKEKSSSTTTKPEKMEKKEKKSIDKDEKNSRNAKTQESDLLSFAKKDKINVKKEKGAESSVSKEKLDKVNKSSAEKSSSSATSIKGLSTKKHDQLKKKARKIVADSDDEESEQSKSNRRSGVSDDSSDDESDDGRRIERKLAKEWKEVLELAGLAEEPAGLSMYDRVKRRSSATYADPWKKGKSSKENRRSNTNNASTSSKGDKFLLLKQKRAKHNQRLKDRSTEPSGQATSDTEENESQVDASKSTSEESEQSSEETESSDDQKKRRIEEEAQRKKAALKKLQQQKQEKEQRRRMESRRSMKKPVEKDKKLRLSIADVFSSEGSSDSEEEAKKGKKHIFASVVSKNSSDNDDSYVSSKTEKISRQVSKDDNQLRKKSVEASKAVEKPKSSKASLFSSIEKRQEDDSAKRGTGRQSKLPTSGGGNIQVEKSSTANKDKSKTTSTIKGETKDIAKKEKDGGSVDKKQKRKDDESEEERRLRKKRRKEQALLKQAEVDKERSVEKPDQGEEQRIKCRTIKRIRTDDSESQPESISIKKRRKLSSPVSSPTPSVSTISNSNLSSVSGLLTKAAMKQVEMPSASSSPQQTPPRTKAAMKAVDTKNAQSILEEATTTSKTDTTETTVVPLQSLDNVDLSSDIVEALKRSMEQDKEEEKLSDASVIMEDRTLEVSVQEEVVEAVEGPNDDEERKAVTSIVQTIEEGSKSKDQEDVTSTAFTFDSSMSSQNASEDKIKPLSVEVENLPTVGEDGHPVLSEQKSDVSHVDEIIDDVVHGYVEIDADKLIKMSANKAAADLAAMTASSMPSSTGLTNSTTPTYVSTTTVTSQAMGQGGFSSQSNFETSNVLFNSQAATTTTAQPHNTDLSLKHLQPLQFQQQMPEKNLHFPTSVGQRLSDAPSINQPLNVPTGSFDSLQQQQPQPQPQNLFTTQSGQISTNQHSQFQMGFQLPPSEIAFHGSTPIVSHVQHAQRLPTVSHHPFIPTTPVTPSMNQPPLSTAPYHQTNSFAAATTTGLTTGVPNYASTTIAQQQYAAFLELQQKQAAWASANLFQGANVGNTSISVENSSQQPRYPTATAGNVQPSLTPQRLDQSGQLREFLVTEQHNQQQQQQSAPPVYQQRPQQTLAVAETNRVPRLLNSYPIVWQGCLVLKNDSALVQMHYVSGNQLLTKRSMPDAEEGAQFACLRISQRMRLESQQLEGVHRRMQLPEEHCVLVALPCGQNRNHIAEQGSILQNAFINYLTQKQAAGIVNVTSPGSNQTSYVVHIFPPCEFSDHYLTGSAGDFLKSIRDHETSYLFVVVTTVVQVM